MKKFYSFVVTFFFIAVSFAQTNTVLTSGRWDNAEIWSEKRLPKTGDIIEIPAGRTLELAGSIDFSLVNMEIQIWVSCD